jgi:hypothetical protein
MTAEQPDRAGDDEQRRHGGGDSQAQEQFRVSGEEFRRTLNLGVDHRQRPIVNECLCRLRAVR